MGFSKPKKKWSSFIELKDSLLKGALIDQWRKFVDLRTMPAIIATLYSLPYKSPHDNPVANGRGLQIAEEFYSLAHEWLAR